MDQAYIPQKESPEKRCLIIKLTSSKKVIYIAFIILFIFLLFCNYFTPYHADDFAYHFNLADNEPLNSISDIIPSMKVHAEILNGRLVVHSIVQFFEMIPKIFFDMANSLVFIAMLWYMAKLTGASENRFMPFFLFAALMIFVPAFGEVFFWLDGSVNYLWAITLNLIFIFPFYRFYTESETKPSVLKGILLIILGLFAGSMQETASAVSIFVNFLFLLAAGFYKKKRITVHYILPLLSACAGLLFMASRPAEIAVKTYAFDVARLYKSFVNVMDYFRLFIVPIFIFIFFFTLCVIGRRDKGRLITALIFFLGFLCANCMMVVAAIYPERTASPAAVFLIISDAIVIYEFFSLEYKKLLIPLMSVFLSASLFLCIYAAVDIVSVYAQFKANEQTIRESIASGQSEHISLPTLFATTKYSVAFDNEFPRSVEYDNDFMARYYGVDSIIGYDYYSQFFNERP